MSDLVGRRLAHFRVDATLGKGGMGVVYRAFDEALRRPVAIKVLPDAVTADVERRRRFVREAQSAAAVVHPNVAAVFEIGEAEGRVYIAMELVDGQTLRTRLSAGPIAVDEAIRVALQIARGVAKAHEKRIVHRDLKPENIILTADGEAKILDFGLARFRETDDPEAGHGSLEHVETATQLTHDGQVMGTPAYMPPEQWSGKSSNARSDVWALGVVLYEMLAGRGPFDGASVAEVMAASLRDAPAAIQGIDVHLRGIVERCLAKAPADRYAQAGDVLCALEGLSTEARSASPRVDARAHGFPGQTTPLLGREPVLARARAMLGRPGLRLLTLTGPGGIGKTRLATRLAEDEASGYEEGAWFVGLAAIRDPGLVLPTVASTLGIKSAELDENLGRRELLLLIDNFEQVVDAAADLSALLAAAPRIKVIVTSRNLLRIDGEHELTVPPLAVPKESDATGAADSEAVRLFVQRALAVNPSLEVKPDRLAEIARLCVLLEGLPLAIELAAARARVMSPAAMAARLARGSLAVLTGGGRDKPARQKTIRDTIAWSHELLDDADRTAFRRMAVFRGGFDVASAAAVVEDGDEDRALSGIESLLDKSLLRLVDGDGERRFTMLETVREFAKEQLAASGEDDAIRNRHATHFLTLAERARSEFDGRDQVEWFARMKRDMDNVRAASSYALERADRSLAMRLATAVAPVWQNMGLEGEGVAAIRATLDGKGEASPDALARAQVALALLYVQLGEPSSVRASAGVALETFRSISDRAGEFDALEASWWASILDFDLGVQTTVFDQMRSVGEALSNPRRSAIMRQFREWMLHERGELESAEVECRAAIAEFSALGDLSRLCWLHNMLGEVLRERGQLAEAERCYVESLALARRIGAVYRESVCASNRGLVRIQAGDYAAARPFAAHALRLVLRHGPGRNVRSVVEGVAWIAAERADERAARLLGACDAWGARTGVALVSADRPVRDMVFAALRSALGDAPFEASISRGRSMTTDETIAEALAISAAWVTAAEP
jgi:non-specific serine/threonine protein kinase